MSRIQLTDTTMDVLVKMAEGNPGAATCLMEILEKGASIDPQSAFGGMGAIFDLDTSGIYGTDIYVLWSDICEKNTVNMLAVLRACQLGLFDRSIVIDAAHRQDRSGKGLIPVDELYAKVKSQLNRFDVA